jgi:hypothetical protein
LFCDLGTITYRPQHDEYYVEHHRLTSFVMQTNLHLGVFASWEQGRSFAASKSLGLTYHWFLRDGPRWLVPILGTREAWTEESSRLRLEGSQRWRWSVSTGMITRATLFLDDLKVRLKAIAT